MSVVVLSKDQLKRLRVALVVNGFCKSQSEARKKTSNHADCKQLAIQLFSYNGVPPELDDVSDLYVVDEPELETSESNSRKTRGAGKAPKLVMYPVRLEPEQLEALKALDGVTSKHIRAAISAYLESR